MQPSIAKIVHSIIHHGLSLRDQLETGEPLDLAAEHETLVAMLEPLALEEIWEAEETHAFGAELSEAESREVHSRLSQATIRGVLIYWLDAFLIWHSMWGSSWREHSLERALLGTESQGKKFWEEARYAETRKDLDALEVLYWCVMLGFRGEGRELSEPTGVWATRIRTLLDDAVVRAEAVPVALEFAAVPAAPLTDLPYRRMAFTALVTLSLTIPVTIWFFLRQWSA